MPFKRNVRILVFGTDSLATNLMQMRTDVGCKVEGDDSKEVKTFDITSVTSLPPRCLKTQIIIFIL